MVMKRETRLEWQYRGAELFIIRNQFSNDAALPHALAAVIGAPWHCGYAKFPKPFLCEKSYWGIVSEICVHGGITYADQEGGAITYGFDCHHSGDEKNPKLKNLGYLKTECEIMVDELLVAAKYEDLYLEAPNKNVAEDIFDAYREECMILGDVKRQLFQ
jgi:hypothetical protein